VVTHILIVDDSDLVTAALRVLFEESGLRVSVARCAADAIAVASDGAPDVMLLDLMLPDGHGLSVLDALREAGHTVPATLALTGRDDPETTARCLAAGCREVLLKPVPPRELMRRVTEHARTPAAG
jgi:DNA-binding response OmpR family regulator